MIDLHAHILPALDDGPKKLAESLDMAQAYVRAGYSRVVATPHWVAGSAWQPPAKKVLKWIDGFRQALADRGMGLEVAQGMEVAMTLGVSQLIQTGDVLTINGGNYVLLEPPFQQLPMGWEQIVFEISAADHRVLLAHPERCSHMMRESGLIEKMVEMGAGIQVNCKSLQGRYGEEIQNTAWNFLEKGFVHCLATDGHSIKDVDVERLKRLRRGLTERLGDERTRLLLEENPKHVWNGSPLERVSPLKTPSKKKTRRRWFKWR